MDNQILEEEPSINNIVEEATGEVNGAVTLSDGKINDEDVGQIAIEKMKLAMLQKPSLKRSREENETAGHVEDIPTAEEARELGKTFETFEEEPIFIPPELAESRLTNKAKAPRLSVPTAEDGI